MILLARGLGPAAFGYFAGSIALGAVAGSILGFGSSAQALRLLAAEEPRRLAAALLWIRLCTAAAVAGIVLAAGLVGPVEVIAAAAIYSATEVISELGQSVLLGMRRVLLGHLAILLRRALPAALLLASGPMEWPALTALSVGWGSTAILTLGLCWNSVARPLPFIAAVRSGVHFWSSTALVNLQNLDVVLVQAIAGPFVGGQYGAASRVVNPLNLFTATILSVLTPSLAAASGAGERARLFRRGQYTLLGYLGLLAAAAPAAYWLGPLVLGHEYQEAAPLFAAFTTAAGISGLSQIHVSLLYALDLARPVATSRLVAIPLGLAILAAATQAAGIYGAAAGIIAMQAVQLGLLHRMVRRLGPTIRARGRLSMARRRPAAVEGPTVGTATSIKSVS
jgi:O-antigen/teichoic acid export membrane protein